MDMKSSLAKQAKHQVDSKDSNGSGVKAINITKEMGQFKPQVGKNKIDIIPFRAGKNNPNTEPGEYAYVLDYWTHKGVGPNNDNILCPAKNYHKPCPICEEIEKMRQSGADWETEVKPLQAKRRVAYNVIDVVRDPKKIQVLDSSHFLFEKELLDEAMSDGELTDFFSLDEGKTVCFRANEKAFKTGKFFEFKSFSFEDRKSGYPESFAKKAYVLDELLNVLTYDEISAIFFGNGIEAENPDADDDDDEEDDDEEDDDEKDDEEEVEEADEEPAPVKKTKLAAEKKASADAENECPFGHNFGKDYEKFPDCDDCDKWKTCM